MGGRGEGAVAGVWWCERCSLCCLYGMGRKRKGERGGERERERKREREGERERRKKERETEREIEREREGQGTISNSQKFAYSH